MPFCIGEGTAVGRHPCGHGIDSTHAPETAEINGRTSYTVH